MSNERRMSSRRLSYAPALLFTGAGVPLGKCVDKDISDTGAKLVCAAGDTPAELLVTMGMVSQRCRVMWRRENEIGVRFAAPAVTRLEPRRG
jgi:hypothetical protein